MKSDIVKLENEIIVRRRHRSRLLNAIVDGCPDVERMMQRLDDLSFLIEEIKHHIFYLRNGVEKLIA